MTNNTNFKLSAIMTILNDVTYLEQSIQSIIEHVDQIVLVDVPFGTNRFLTDTLLAHIKSLNPDKITHIKVDRYIPRFQAIQIGEEASRNQWIMRWDSDFIAYDDIIIPPVEGKTTVARPFRDLIKNCELKQTTYEIFYLYAPIFAWDFSYSKNANLFKTHNLYIALKGKVKYDYNDKYHLIYKFDSSKILYLNNPFQNVFYFAYMAECKTTDEIIFNICKNNYYLHLIIHNLAPDKYPFDKFYLENFNKKLKYAASGITKNIKNNIIKNNHPIPHILAMNPGLIKYEVKEINGIMYRDIIYTNLREVNDAIQTEVTIVTLMRNTEPYLKEYFESIFNQTYTKWNLIMVNDGSLGGPLNLDQYIDSQYSHFKSKIKLVEFANWQGLVKCHLEAMKHVENDIVIIFDSDDTLDPTALDYFVYTYNVHDIKGDSDIFVYGNFFYCDAKMNINSLGYNRPTVNTYLIDRPGVACRSFRMRHYLRTTGYDSDLLFGAEDQDLLFQISRIAKPVYLDKYLYNYRRIGFGGSISSMRRMSTYSLQLAIIKNAFHTYGDNKFYLRIYSNINSTERSVYILHNQYQIHGDSGIKIEGIHYLIEININHHVPFIIYSTIADYKKYQDLIDHYIQLYHQGINNTPIEISWNPLSAVWEVSDKSFNFDEARIFTPNHYFDHIWGLSPFKLNGIRCDKVVEYKDIKTEISKIEFKKLLIITDPTKIPSNMVLNFNTYIRSIPYDWSILWFKNRETQETFGIGIDVGMRNNIESSNCISVETTMDTTIYTAYL